jgi:hypothetical protein
MEGEGGRGGEGIRFTYQKLILFVNKNCQGFVSKQKRFLSFEWKLR